MIKKIVGWALLFLGVAIIIWSLWSSVNIFTGKKLPPEIFKSSQQEPEAQLEIGAPKDTSSQKKSLSSQEQLQQQAQQEMQKGIVEGLGKMLPIDALTKFFNLGVWLILVWILTMGGGKISGIGIQLLKTN